MVVLEFRSPVRDDHGHLAGPEVVARLIVDGADVRIEGDESVVDFEQHVLNLRTGESISFADDHEEWVRGLSAAYRTPYLWAEIVEDTNPLEDVEIERAEIADPAHGTPAVH